MKKKAKRKYKLKESVKDLLMISFLCFIILFAMLYQAERVEQEKQQKQQEENSIVLYVNEK